MNLIFSFFFFFFSVVFTLLKSLIFFSMSANLVKLRKVEVSVPPLLGGVRERKLKKNFRLFCFDAEEGCSLDALSKLFLKKYGSSLSAEELSFVFEFSNESGIIRMIDETDVHLLWELSKDNDWESSVVLQLAYTPPGQNSHCRDCLSKGHLAGGSACTLFHPPVKTSKRAVTVLDIDSSESESGSATAAEVDSKKKKKKKAMKKKKSKTAVEARIATLVHLEEAKEERRQRELTIAGLKKLHHWGGRQSEGLFFQRAANLILLYKTFDAIPQAELQQPFLKPGLPQQCTPGLGVPPASDFQSFLMHSQMMQLQTMMSPWNQTLAHSSYFSFLQAQAGGNSSAHFANPQAGGSPSPNLSQSASDESMSPPSYLPK